MASKKAPKQPKNGMFVKAYRGDAKLSRRSTNGSASQLAATSSRSRTRCSKTRNWSSMSSPTIWMNRIYCKSFLNSQSRGACEWFSTTRPRITTQTNPDGW